ncbi:MAG: rod shape-determining protein MreD [Longimicrobiales bacterium]
MATRSTPAFWVFFGLLLTAYFLLHVGLGLGASVPDLLTVALLLGVRRVRSSVAAALGLVLGLIQDALAFGSFGADALTLTILGYLGARSRDLFEGDSLLFVGAYLFLGKWLHDLGYWALAPANSRSDFVAEVLLRSPLAALYAAGAGVMALVIFRAVTGEK